MWTFGVAVIADADGHAVLRVAVVVVPYWVFCAQVTQLCPSKHVVWQLIAPTAAAASKAVEKSQKHP